MTFIRILVCLAFVILNNVNAFNGLKCKSINSRTLSLNAWSFPWSQNSDKNTKSNKFSLSKKRVVIVGATGYIGKFVVKESIRRGYETVAVIRPSSIPKDDFFNGAEIITADVMDEKSVLENVFVKPADVVISCLASRSGIKSDSYAIDYQATLNTLNAARAKNVGHFILLSAFCVRKPLLEFQKAKLEFEQELQDAKDIK
jgi:hypothetical protein